jgi:replicative DNA helicase
MKSFNDAFDGLQPGLIIVAGAANVGKSALCMQLSWRIAYANQKVEEGVRPSKAYVIYFSLDDNATEILPRVVALEENIPINVVKAPVKFEDERPDLISRRANGVKKLKGMLNYFKVVDSTQGTSIEFIEETIRKHHFELQSRDETYKLVVVVDNFHDITVDGMNFRDNDTAKFTYISDKLSKICTQFDIPVICTAELRKLNGTRRPIVDDVRESGKIAYEAKAIMLCYNEVGLRGEAASIYFNRGEAEFANYKQPVLEVKVGKNKYSSYKGRLFYNFYPESSLLREADSADTLRYAQMIIG